MTIYKKTLEEKTSEETNPYLEMVKGTFDKLKESLKDSIKESLEKDSIKNSIIDFYSIYIFLN